MGRWIDRAVIVAGVVGGPVAAWDLARSGAAGLAWLCLVLWAVFLGAVVLILSAEDRK